MMMRPQHSPDPILVGNQDGPYWEELVFDESTGEMFLIGATSLAELDRISAELLESGA